MKYSIGETAKKLNISAHTLRYYDKEGLLPFVDRDKNGVRVFKNSDFFMLYIIECMKASGMQLKDIKHYIDLHMQGDGTMRERRDILAKQQIIVNEKIEALKECLSMLSYQLWYYEEAIEHGSMEVHLKRGRSATHKAYEEATGKIAPWPQSDLYTDNYNRTENNE